MTALEEGERAFVDALGLDDGFGDWFAGFVDGEGHFGIRKCGPRGFPCLQTYFDLTQRVDNPVLYVIHRRLGMGHVHEEQKRGSNPTARLRVTSREECWLLCLILRRYPLRGKKREDYECWYEAVFEWLRMRKGREWGETRDTRRSPVRWDRMRELKAELEAGRRFNGAN